MPGAFFCAALTLRTPKTPKLLTDRASCTDRNL
jgi:hypothetical protein